jgi:2,5-diamino-6-(ribosylamino)-4(3H)-pyrimidinone 5'-phosphate reductase
MGRPYVTVFSTTTLDGRIASSTGYSILSCRYDKARLYLLRGHVDAVMVGASTILVDDSTLRKRLRPARSRYLRVVVDGRLRLHPGLRVFREPGPPVIVFTAVGPEEAERRLQGTGALVYSVPGREPGRVDLPRALRILHERHGVRRLLVEGGGVLNYSLASAGLVDEVRLTLTPHLFAAGRSFFDDPAGAGFLSTREGPRLRLACSEACPCGRCVHLVYEVLGASPGAADTPPPRCLSEEARRAVEEGWEPIR